MSNELIKASIVPPPTKHEIRVAAARIISLERAERNKRRLKEIEKAEDRLRSAVQKHAKPLLQKAKLTAWPYYGDARKSGEWKVEKAVEIKIEGHLIPLRKAIIDLHATPAEEADETAIVRQLREREHGMITKTDRVEAILATPALRKAVKEFGEKLLATPTAQDKAKAINVAGGAQ